MTPPSTGSIVVKTMVTHTVTYFVMGVLAYTVFDYHRLYADTSLKHLMRQTTERIVMAGPLFQPIRGVIFGLVFVLVRRSLFDAPGGWLRMWAVLVALGILNTFGPAPSSIEGMIYTTLPIPLQLIGLPEVVFQALLLSAIVCYWVGHPEKRWLSWVMGSAFVLVVVLITLGLLVAAQS